MRAHCDPDHGRSEDVVSEENGEREELHADAALRVAQSASSSYEKQKQAKALGRGR